jgi:protein TonB
VDLHAIAGRPEDRLATALFVAALLHGLLILGVRFAAPRPEDRPLPTLEVLLVPAGPPEAANPEAAYLSSRDQRGAGTGRERQRTSLPEASASVVEQAGDLRGTSLAPPAPESSRAGVAVLAAPAPRGRQSAADEAVEQSAPASRPLESRALAQVGVNASAADETLRLRGDPSPDDRLVADTRESQIAAYLDGWKRRVEQIGTLHFPEVARRRSLSGNPVLEVAVRADGSLQQVIVRRSSGHRELDAAAIGIVRLAAPFQPFPPAMRERYPLLRFAYEWQFQGGRPGSGALLAPAP